MLHSPGQITKTQSHSEASKTAAVDLPWRRRVSWAERRLRWDSDHTKRRVVSDRQVRRKESGRVEQGLQDVKVKVEAKSLPYQAISATNSHTYRSHHASAVHANETRSKLFYYDRSNLLPIHHARLQVTATVAPGFYRFDSTSTR